MRGGIEVIAASPAGDYVDRLKRAGAGSYPRSLTTALGGILVMAAALMALRQPVTRGLPPALWTALQIAAGATVYVLVTYLLGRETYRKAREALREGLISWPGDRRLEEPVDAI